MRIIACITEPRVVGRILRHLAHRGWRRAAHPAPIPPHPNARSPARDRHALAACLAAGSRLDRSAG